MHRFRLIPFVLFLLSFLLFGGGCHGVSVSDKDDFARWGRGKDCCMAQGRAIAVASGGGHSSKAGVEIYDKGGNAVDAAVATAFTLAVERSCSLGLGGGGFLLVHLAGAKPHDYFIDFRETAPHRASAKMYLDAAGKVIPGLSLVGPLAMATPGFVAGLFEAHSRWGKLPLKTVLGPAIRLAREGFAVYPDLAEAIADNAAIFAKDPYLRGIFLSSMERP